MFNNYNISNADQLITKGEDNWYKFSSVVIKSLFKDGIPKEILEDLLISHLIETQFFVDIFNLLNYIYSKPTLTDFEQSIKNYFDGKLLQVKSKEIKGLLLLGWGDKTPIQQLVVLNGNTWKLAEAEDYRELAPSIRETIVPENKRNNTYGFIANFKNKDMLFKIKQNKAGHGRSA